MLSDHLQAQLRGTKSQSLHPRVLADCKCLHPITPRLRLPPEPSKHRNYPFLIGRAFLLGCQTHPHLRFHTARAASLEGERLNHLRCYLEPGCFACGTTPELFAGWGGKLLGVARPPNNQNRFLPSEAVGAPNTTLSASPEVFRVRLFLQ